MSELGFTNTVLIDAFENDLKNFESSVNPDSAHFYDFVKPADFLRQALVQLVNASASDTYSMMRKLMSRASGQLEGAYSYTSIHMAHGATRDTNAKKLIAAIMFTVHDVISGAQMILDDRWLGLAGGNEALKQFFDNYSVNKDSIGETTYSGNAVLATRFVEKIVEDNQRVIICVDDSDYDVRLLRYEPQHVSFGISQDTKARVTSGGRSSTLYTEVTLTPSVASLILDKSIIFSDDAGAQLSALNKTNERTDDGDLIIKLPDLFFSLFINVISNDGGDTWRVVELNVLPPSVQRSCH
jgi:hypothetical protein